MIEQATAAGLALAPGQPSWSADIAAWQCIREVVTEHLALLRAEVTDRLGISVRKARALLTLAAGPLTMGELTIGLGTDAPYTSVLVDDLVNRGLARRTSHRDDRRRKVVALTVAGVDCARLAREIIDRPPPGFAELAPAELDQLAAVFEKVRSPPGESVVMDPFSRR